MEITGSEWVSILVFGWGVHSIFRSKLRVFLLSGETKS